MGMNGVLCALSEARRAMLEEDPDLLQEVIAHRHRERIPGLLDLDKAWMALDILLGEDQDAVLGDAVLGRSGPKFGPKLSYGRGRLLLPDRVAAVAAALGALPEGLVDQRYDLLAGREVHGGYGPKPLALGPAEYAQELADLGDDGDEDEEQVEREELETRIEGLKAFYRAAAEKGQSVLCMVV
jgi:hypothetical protein